VTEINHGSDVQPRNFLPMSSIPSLPTYDVLIKGMLEKEPVENILPFNEGELKIAYKKCREIIKNGSKTFFLGASFLPYEKRRSIWAVYSFCRYTDDLVDNAKDLSNEQLAQVLADWETEIETNFQRTNRPSVPHLLAWQHSCANYEITRQPARDLIAGMRMDLTQSRYQNFEELKLYCYRVASTVGLLVMPIIGYERSPETIQQAIDLGIAKQLTNILRDVGEDAANGRIYIPLDEMREFGYTEDELLGGVINANFRRLMNFQIERAREYYQRALPGIEQLDKDGRFAIALAARMYSRILNVIERNKYDVFTKRAFVPTLEKFRLVSQVWTERKFRKARG
jgi:15-cis-phytoene synthase